MLEISSSIDIQNLMLFWDSILWAHTRILKKMEETTRYELKKVKENKKWVEYLHLYKELEQVMVFKSSTP